MLLTAVFPVLFGEYWFISAFVVMMLFAPFINVVLDVMNRNQVMALTGTMFFVTFIWKFINPGMNYFADWGYLCSVYLVGAIIRRYVDTLPKFGLPSVIMISVVCFIACTVVTVVPEKLRTLDRGRPWRDSQFASTRLSPSRDMSR